MIERESENNPMINKTPNTANAAALSLIPETSNRFPISAEHLLQTARLNLRPVSEADSVDYLELFSDPAVMRFIGIEAGSVPTDAEIQDLHNRAIQAWKTRGYGRWSLFDRKTNEFIGLCGFRSEQGMPELICALHERFWGKGLATEASRACLTYGFETLGFTNVKAFTRPHHTRARKVLDKLGAEFLAYTDFHGVEGAAYQLMPELPQC